MKLDEVLRSAEVVELPSLPVITAIHIPPKGCNQALGHDSYWKCKKGTRGCNVQHEFPLPAQRPLALPPWKGDGYDEVNAYDAKADPDEVESVTDFVEKAWNFLRDSMELLAQCAQMDYVSVTDRAEMAIVADRIKRFVVANTQNVAEML